MSPEMEKMASLAEELIAYNDFLLHENESLKCQQKEASAALRAPAASEGCVDDTCKALVAAGLITPAQFGQTKQAFMTDPEAVHRTVKCLIDARTQTKSAAADCDLSGGTLVSGRSVCRDVYSDSMDRLQSILGIRY